MPERPAENSGRKVRLKPITISQNETLPAVFDMKRPLIFGNQ